MGSTGQTVSGLWIQPLNILLILYMDGSGFLLIQELTRPQNATAVFEGWEDTIVLSCLSGMMGHIYGDDLVNPSAALAVLGDFCFFTGRPSPELIDFAAGLFCRGGILVPQNEGWSALSQSRWKQKLFSSTRYATGYTVTASYMGQVAKTGCEVVTYTAIFGSEELAKEEKPADPSAPSNQTGPEAPDTDPSPTETGGTHWLSLLGCAGGVAALAAVALWTIQKMKERRT